jgi:hypothetical protein
VLIFSHIIVPDTTRVIKMGKDFLSINIVDTREEFHPQIVNELVGPWHTVPSRTVAQVIGIPAEVKVLLIDLATKICQTTGSSKPDSNLDSRSEG